MCRFLLLASFAIAAVAKTVNYKFNVGWVTAAPDGYSRPVIGINGKWPIPIIEANVGDQIVVEVTNSLGNESTSLHFHGMFQTGTAGSDGAVGLTQCPIPPGGSYTYSFTANPAGTHWYHSHDKGQYPDGLRGLMIIHDPSWEQSLGVDSQIYLTMSEWYHTQMPPRIQAYLSPDNTNGNFASPDSMLVNDTKTPPQLKFAAGKKYLTRIANVGGLACGQFHIEGYTLSVVEADGVQMQPQNVDTILVCAGQTYGVVVQGKSNPLGGANWIVKMTTDMLTEAIPPASAITVIGDLVYSLLGSLLTTITDLLNLDWVPAAVFDDFNLKPRDGQKLLSPVGNNIELSTNQTYYPGIGTRIKQGGQPWTNPKVPSLYTALTTGKAASDPATYGPGADPWVLTYGQIVQINYHNPNPYPHPLHLHGHVFQVVARGSGSWDGNEKSLPSVPMKRDVAVVPAQGYIVMRFQANNPGVWFFHCHIDLHLVGGMATTFIEAPDQLQSSQSVPSQGQGLCKASGQSSSGNCAGGSGSISASDAASKCNTIFNSSPDNKGALVS